MNVLGIDFRFVLWHLQRSSPSSVNSVVNNVALESCLQSEIMKSRSLSFFPGPQSNVRQTLKDEKKEKVGKVSYLNHSDPDRYAGINLVPFLTSLTGQQGIMGITWRSVESECSCASASQGCEMPCGKTHGRCPGTWCRLEEEGKTSMCLRYTGEEQCFEKIFILRYTEMVQEVGKLCGRWR